MSKVELRVWNFNKSFNKSRIANFYCSRTKDLEYEKGKIIRIKKIKFSPSNDFDYCDMISIYYTKAYKN